MPFLRGDSTTAVSFLMPILLLLQLPNQLAKISGFLLPFFVPYEGCLGERERKREREKARDPQKNDGSRLESVVLRLYAGDDGGFHKPSELTVENATTALATQERVYSIKVRPFYPFFAQR